MMPTTDPETAALAAALAGEAPPTDQALIENKDGSVGLTPGPGDANAVPPSQGKEGAAPTEPASQGGEGGEGTPGDEGEKDPLDDLEIEKLLSHPKLGPILNRWADQAAVAQVRAALERDRETTKTLTRRQVEDEAFDREVSEMEPEELAANLRDPSFRTKYAQYVERSQAPHIDEEALKENAQVFAFAAEIAIYQNSMKEAGLPQEIMDKPELQTSSYTQYGQDGIAKWGAAVTNAILEHKAEARAQELLEEKWEAYLQGKVAESDGVRPPLTTARRANVRPDIMRTDSSSLLEAALSKENK